jgi:nucleoside-diphosphate-sugar epimerase
MSGNLAKPADCERSLDDIGSVYHLAAAMRGAPADMFLNTVVASKNLLAALAKHQGTRITVVSSLAVYAVGSLSRGAVVTEATPIEARPEKRDIYAHTKIWQERLFWTYREQFGLPIVVLRPGPIIGPGGSALPNRIGIDVFGTFLELGGRHPLPLTYVTNCADAIALAGMTAADGSVFNVVDDDVPTCRAYLRRYKREVKKIRSIAVPYFALERLAKLVDWYSRYSEGQLPPVLTPSIVAAKWKPVQVEAMRIRQLGWRPAVSIDEAIARTFASLAVTVPPKPDHDVQQRGDERVEPTREAERCAAINA